MDKGPSNPSPWVSAEQLASYLGKRAFGQLGPQDAARIVLGLEAAKDPHLYRKLSDSVTSAGKPLLTQTLANNEALTSYLSELMPLLTSIQQDSSILIQKAAETVADARSLAGDVCNLMPIGFAALYKLAGSAPSNTDFSNFTSLVTALLDITDSAGKGYYNELVAELIVVVSIVAPAQAPGIVTFIQRRGPAIANLAAGKSLDDFSPSPGVTLRKSLEEFAWWGGLVCAVLLAVGNAALFVAARKSAWAWRLATDGGLPTLPLRVATLILSHSRRAQSWILALYYNSRKRALARSQPFFPLPLTGIDGSSVASDKIIQPPWKGRRLWVQGNSGMGKTALFLHLTHSHFGNYPTIEAALSVWGCVVVAFHARDFAGGQDELKPDWVVGAVKASLSRRKLTFEDDRLLKRMLYSGTIAVAIDGLHEAGRYKAVNAFVQEFADVPVFITSQHSGGPDFQTYRLPSDMRNFVEQLLQVYLGETHAGRVMNDIRRSGLLTSIRSGYDVRLIVDTVRMDKEAPLPSDRIGLYEAVLQAGWPRTSAEERGEQQDRTAAAAWCIVSERKPNDDKRRLIPGQDLDENLLTSLADAPEKDNRPVRLISRVGNAFEFVHDQMHAFLAARWFTQGQRGVTELFKMVSTASVWSESAPARRTLWNFVAVMLDDRRLNELWSRVEDQEEWDILRRELKEEARRRGLKQQQEPASPSST